MNAQEAMCSNAAVQERAQLALDEAGNQAVALPLPGEESFEMLGDDLVQNALLCTAGMVGLGGFADGETGIRR